LIRHHQGMDVSGEAFNADGEMGKAGQVVHSFSQVSLPSFNAPCSIVSPHHDLGALSSQINNFEFAEKNKVESLPKAPTRDQFAKVVGPRPIGFNGNVKAPCLAVTFSLNPAVSMDVNQQNLVADPNFVAHGSSRHGPI